jgi:anti-sigma28 factor (negative regulator of flagellin synthesis)
MTELPPIQAASAGRITPAEQQADRPAERRAAKPRRGDDRVEVSDAARFLAKMNAMPEIRAELVDRVRGEIARGTYDTPERFDLAVDAMIDEMN